MLIQASRNSTNAPVAFSQQRSASAHILGKMETLAEKVISGEEKAPPGDVFQICSVDSECKYPGCGDGSNGHCHNPDPPGPAACQWQDPEWRGYTGLVVRPYRASGYCKALTGYRTVACHVTVLEAYTKLREANEKLEVRRQREANEANTKLREANEKLAEANTMFEDRSSKTKTKIEEAHKKVEEVDKKLAACKLETQK